MAEEAGAGAEDTPKPLHLLTASELERKEQVARVTTEVLRHLTGEFARRGFEWMLPVVLAKSTDPLWPDPGASIEKRVEVEIYGERVRTTHSMIVHKLVACSMAYPRLFILSPNIRIEKRERKNTGRHVYEFTQLDFELRGAGFDDVRELVEGVVTGLVARLKETGQLPASFCGGAGVEAPFDVFDRRDLVARYGEEWERALPQRISRPVWVTNIPREFYDFEDSDTGRWDNYDLFVPDYGEILSGARREWEYGRIVAKMNKDGVDQKNFSLFLRLAEEGRIKPSAGGGIGIERVVGWITGAKHIGEVQPFPRVPGVVYDL
ncbi:MAG: asparagine synthetase [Nitrososphaerota archaeon]|jgi:asparaginyl-tRNA synthetase|nr:asparagine synthetase [Nitrososphaerota archaeon]MDG6943202.1 asparagine synthetase [Nitrososphaerota archaeon]MDG6950920.1 asparagine synthetase [Nitrososphaerota archaeon]